MSETTFENARAGDRCFSPMFRSKNPNDRTNATICRINNKECLYPVKVEPDIECADIINPCFTLIGGYYTNSGQLLFWENPIKEIPVRPKRKVIKNGWMGLVPSPTASIGGCLAMTTCVYADSSDVPYMSNEKQKLIAVQFEVEE